MLAAAAKALNQIFTPPFRSVLWRSLAITLLLLVVIWFGIEGLIGLFVLPWPWLETAVSILAGLGVMVGLAFLIGPITSAVAGLFLDEVAGHVERTRYPADRPGRELPLATSLVLSAKFAGLVIAVNLVALFLLLLPGINLVAFLAANGYLLGREYFELAAMRHMPVGEARALRRAHGGRIFFAGMLIAGFMAVPLVNLLTPLFATAFMVHMFKDVQRRSDIAGSLAARR